MSARVGGVVVGVGLHCPRKLNDVMHIFTLASPKVSTVISFGGYGFWRKGLTRTIEVGKGELSLRILKEVAARLSCE